MIHSVKCDKSSFKTVTFTKGFNVILADASERSDQKDSMNGVGKSTLVEIIQFCLGARPINTLLKAEVRDWTFSLDIDLGAKRYTISRNPETQNVIYIEGDCTEWAIRPKRDVDTNKQIMSSANFNKVLGTLLFGLQLDYKEYKYTPEFRDIISCFLRRSKDFGFVNPFRYYLKQQEYSIQISNTFLLGLGWEYASKFESLRNKATFIQKFKQAAREGMMSDVFGDIGELEAQKITLKESLVKQEGELNKFNVLPQYRQIEIDVNRLTETMHDIVNQNISDKQIIDYYKSSLSVEKDANPDKVIRAYKEAGLILPASIEKNIDKVFEFHAKVVSNRKDFLNNEIFRLEQINQERNKQLDELGAKKEELMQILKTHRALEEYIRLHSNYQTLLTELNNISKRIENLNAFEKGRIAIQIEQKQLLQEGMIDLNSRISQKTDAISTFNSYSEKLYNKPGTLAININENGFKFSVSIKSSGSSGIGNMEIFCYDLMLARLWSSKPISPRFIVHDSNIFADVDKRQVANAIELAESESKKYNFQYICELNSDSIPTKWVNDSFNLYDYVRITLTDAEKGGLLGITF